MDKITTASGVTHWLVTAPSRGAAAGWDCGDWLIVAGHYVPKRVELSGAYTRESLVTDPEHTPFSVAESITLNGGLPLVALS